jgi:hypothetical protein
MSTVYEKLAENFARWEMRGRGVLTYAEPVSPRPPFLPFPGHRVPVPPQPDTGLRATFLSRLADRVTQAIRPPTGREIILKPHEIEEPEPDWLGWDEPDLVEISLLLPSDFTASPEAMAHFLSSISLTSQPVALECLGVQGRVMVQFCTHLEDADLIAGQLAAHFPEVICRQPTAGMEDAWGHPDDEDERVVIDFGLANPFMLPLAPAGKSDLFVGLAGALASLNADAAGVYQVIFTPVSEPWSAHALAAVSRPDGKPFFDDGAELVKGAREKMSRPLYGVIVRLAARAPTLGEVWQAIRRMAAPLRLVKRHDGNELAPVPNDDYDHHGHCYDLALRRSRRVGMILNQDELISFIRFPTAAVRIPAFVRVDAGTRAVTQPSYSTDGVCLGINEHAGLIDEVWLTTEQRVRHLHVIGGSGSGKTTLMFNLLRQDIENGAGFALLDPHGDLVDKVLGVIPLERIDDVVLLDPSDEQFIVPFNFLSAHSDFEKTLLASDLVAIFRAQSTSWGDQMNSVFGNAIRAFLESSEGGTLADLRRFLLDPEWRERFLTTVSDPEIVFYWKRGFPQLGGNKSIGPILTRLENFLAPKPIRYMVSQRENRLDFADIMDSGKIFLAKLPQGQMGKENSHLLGALIVAKLQQMAMSRQRMDTTERRAFFVYADEFQNFICPSMAEILSGARKYRMGFILAHQDLRQLDRDKEVGSAVLSNAFTRVVFRVGDSDARTLAEGFAHFDAKALQNLPIGKALCRIERADNDFNLTVPLPEEPDEDEAATTRLIHTRASRQSHARPRADVEAELYPQTAEPEVAPPRRDKEQPTPKPKTPPEEKSPATVPHEPEVPAEPVAVSEPVSVAPLESSAPAPGKGGPLHIKLQKLIKAAAEARGFRAVLESPTGTGKETVDVALLRDDLRIACEISVSTSIEHELSNARKCLLADFHSVALIPADDRRHAQLCKAIAGTFTPGELARLRCFTAEEFITYVTTLPEAPSAKPGEKTIRGWRVKRTHVKLTDEERAAKTKAAFDLLAQDMKLPPEV